MSKLRDLVAELVAAQNVRVVKSKKLLAAVDANAFVKDLVCRESYLAEMQDSQSFLQQNLAFLPRFLDELRAEGQDVAVKREALFMFLRENPEVHLFDARIYNAARAWLDVCEQKCDFRDDIRTFLELRNIFLSEGNELERYSDLEEETRS